MTLRRIPALLLLLLALPLAGCKTVLSLVIIPAAGVEILTAVGQTAQFKAMATSQTGSSPADASDVTTSSHWSSSIPSVATISATGLVTAVGEGNTTITAENGGIIATSDVTVTIGAGGTAPVQTLTIIPASGVQTLSALGQTAQFKAIATSQIGTGTPTTSDVTNQVAWAATNASVATISASGLATAVGIGNTAITAELGSVIGSSNLTVAIPTVPVSAPTLTLIPITGVAEATFIGETTQFIAIGNLTGAGATQDLTDQVTWSSSDVAVATINQAGLATAVGANAAINVTTITALVNAANGSVLTATSSLEVLPIGGSVNVATLALYEIGTGSGTVTGALTGSDPSLTPVLTCTLPATAQATCTGNFPISSQVTLTATPASSFAGWSANCTPSVTNPLQCTLTMSGNKTVGAIFNVH